MKIGKFVVLEGGDGSGKTTILKRLEALKSGKNLLITREPGGSEFGERIRNILFSSEGKTLNPLTQFHLFFAARADHVEKVILPALRLGKNVISDRFSASTFAHQIFGEGHHEFFPAFKAAQEVLRGMGISPTYLYLDIDPEIGLSRKKKVSDGNFFDTKGLEYHCRVRVGYREFARLERMIKIDASRSRPEVWKDFYVALEKALA